jgi:hypothetical protein
MGQQARSQSRKNIKIIFENITGKYKGTENANQVRGRNSFKICK